MSVIDADVGTAVKQLLLRGMPSPTLRGLRLVRTAGLRLLDPIDAAARAINNKQRLPPFHLRREVGDPSAFESSGAEFLAYCKLLGGLRPDGRVLDIGCGCGLMALFLEEYLAETGSYLGIDVQAEPVRWCQSHITSRSPNFRFAHLDVANQRYNPRGKSAAMSIPADDRAFDLVIVKSVFTHVLPHDVESYLPEISRVLDDGGRCLASWFLFTPGAPSSERPRGALTFDFGGDACRYQSQRSPETAVAYAEPYVRCLLERHGLTLLAPVYPGTWSRRADGLSAQDLTIIGRAG
jgi:SAM-dependent methyltransferase